MAFYKCIYLLTYLLKSNNKHGEITITGGQFYFRNYSY